MDQLYLVAFDSIAVAFEMFIVHMFLRVFFEKKAEKKAWLLLYLTFGAALVALSRFYPNMYVLLGVTFIGVVSVSFLIFDGSAHSRLFLSILFCFLVAASEIAGSGIISALTATQIINVLEYGELRIISSVLANLLCLLIIKVLGVFIKKKTDPPNKRLWELTPLLLFLLFSIYLLVVCFSDTLAYRDQFTFIFVLEILAIVYMNIMVFWYYDRIMRIHELRHEKEVMKINTNSQIRYYELVRKQQDKLTALLHDTRKHEKVMEDLAGKSADPHASR